MSNLLEWLLWKLCRAYSNWKEEKDKLQRLPPRKIVFIDKPLTYIKAKCETDFNTPWKRFWYIYYILCDLFNQFISDNNIGAAYLFMLFYPECWMSDYIVFFGIPEGHEFCYPVAFWVLLQLRPIDHQYYGYRNDHPDGLFLFVADYNFVFEETDVEYLLRKYGDGK